MMFSQDGMLLDGTETKDATKSVPSVLETSAEQNGMESEQSEHPQVRMRISLPPCDL